jgi:hypothetical protein
MFSGVVAVNDHELKVAELGGACFLTRSGR